MLAFDGGAHPPLILSFGRAALSSATHGVEGLRAPHQDPRADPRRRCRRPAGAAHPHAREARRAVRRHAPADRLPAQQLPQRADRRRVDLAAVQPRVAQRPPRPTGGRGTSTARPAGCSLLHPRQGNERGTGFQEGTAEALWSQAELIREFDPEALVVVSADAVYKLDYGALVEEHCEAGKAVTMVTTEVDPEDADRYGVVQVNGDRVHRVRLQARRAQGQRDLQRGVRVHARAGAGRARRARRGARRGRARGPRPPPAAAARRRRRGARAPLRRLLARRRHDRRPTTRATWSSWRTSRRSTSTTRRGRSSRARSPTARRRRCARAPSIESSLDRAGREGRGRRARAACSGAAWWSRRARRSRDSVLLPGAIVRSGRDRPPRDHRRPRGRARGRRRGRRRDRAGRPSGRRGRTICPAERVSEVEGD